MRRWLPQLILPLLGAGLLLLGVAAIGRMTHAHLRQQDRFSLPFAEIECEPPGGMARGEFLDEVQYLAGLPDHLPRLDDALAERLAAAFAGHPWVEKVERVEVGSAGRARVQLSYRTPILAVADSGQLRAVDRDGKVLPVRASTAGLPIYEGPAPSPAGPVGAPWGDPAVEQAARLAAGVDPAP